MLLPNANPSQTPANFTPFEKLKVTTRSRLLGAASVDKRFHLALDAFHYVEQQTAGMFRKDKVTPEFYHPLGVAAFLFTIQGCLIYPAETFAAAFLHDIPEDQGVSIEFVRDRFGPLVAHGVMRMSKVINGVKLGTDAEYYGAMDCPISTVLKPVDRFHNQGHMQEGGFSPSKQLKYVGNTEEFILPMMKRARRRFSVQEPAYENLKLILTTQIRMVRAAHTPAAEIVAG